MDPKSNISTLSSGTSIYKRNKVKSILGYINKNAIVGAL